jgi:hypothetical protein
MSNRSRLNPWWGPRKKPVIEKTVMEGALFKGGTMRIICTKHFCISEATIYFCACSDCSRERMGLPRTDVEAVTK